jgi:hypothetical protein
MSLAQTTAGRASVIGKRKEFLIIKFHTPQPCGVPEEKAFDTTAEEKR